MSQKFSHYKIRLASPEEIRGWSYGEVKKHETINYRTLKPEKDGLFCEVIFGPTKDYQCACSNKSKRNSHVGKKCPVCGVEITESKVRRERMGHIELAAPVVHTWYLRNSPSRLATLLDIKSKDLEEVVYLASYIVIDKGDTDLTFKEILSEADYSRKYMEYGTRFKALTGADAVKVLLRKLDLAKESQKLRSNLGKASKQKREKIIKRLEVVEAFKNSDNKPEWMVLDVLPVIPPELRPMVQLDGGRFATTDLNDLYRRILNRNNRLKRQFEQNAPHLITKNEKRMLQEAVDALIDNSKRGRKVVVEKNRPLKSLSDMLRGKQGRFRQNLLGKRVDYSGRSVIVVGPDLEMYQCGLPKEMAITLFKPFVIRELITREITSNIRSAKSMIDRLDNRIWEVLEDVIREHPVLLNRAPTLHRLGIQAFEPILVAGKAIRLHPLVTTAFNADFDGDQMAVHVPLSEEAQAEARVLILASNNILNPKDGKPIVTPSQDMVLGNYYLTLEKAGEIGEGKVFGDFNEAGIAYENKKITLHTRIALRGSALGNAPLTAEQKEGYLVTTYGKLTFNEILPKSFPYLNEPTLHNLQVNTPDVYFLKRGSNIKEEIAKMPLVDPFKKKFLSLIISQVFIDFKINETSKMLDKMKNLGFKYSTYAGITVSAFDVKTYSHKGEVLKASDERVAEISELYQMGLLTDNERYKLVIGVWAEAKDIIQKGLMEELSNDNHIFMMSDSGARGNASNFTQLAGMRGLMANPSGGTIELPIKAAFREGLTMSEFFISTHGARKGSTDTALKTADSGYLTRRLVDVSQDVVITENDCKTDRGVIVHDILDSDGKIIEPLRDRLTGRYTQQTVVHPETGEVIIGKDEYITEQLSEMIVVAGIEEIVIRSVSTCNAKNGICKKCYGQNLATGEQVEVGESVGTIAAQSIGEPGTQLTMRTFHTGGVAGADITQGLPRIQELFEARTPKGKSIISEIDGTISDIEIIEERYKVTVENGLESHTYETNSGVSLLVSEGQDVYAGDQITEGSIDPKQLLKVTNTETVQQYILKEVQKVYRSQGVEISDKHIEIIVHQMMKKLNVIIEGETTLLPGAQVSINEFKEANRRALLEGKRPAIARPVLLGITRASLRSDSFLSAASFQETTRVLTDAAIRGKVDYLLGLKENVIIGGLIPAGTGILKHTHFDYEKPEAEVEEPNPYLLEEYEY
ncbi:DNA-directed RNA polymerase subunit beta' [Candidatus Izimaplasma bacterium ZiA1]|uniref:DNA-directed RNA polymerase subunit beta' n=1 Tax=Candidatus Izimoplasma sp. ZiA1 TaxID=2024899 RepID=UPI000BAA519F|nr:DNA-directed RNA polymerase subunit beta' [Candidatus Izimaplasma bacterium ZiA1]